MNPHHPQSPPSDREGEPTEQLFLGRLVSSQRRERKWSLRELSHRSGVSEGLLSQLERGMANPSLQTMQKIARALALQLTDLFYDLGDDGPLEVPAVAAEPTVEVVTADHGKRLQLPHDDITYELLTPKGRTLGLLRSTIPPGFDGRGAPFRHAGEESTHLLEGVFRAHVAHQVFEMSERDTITFPSDKDHWWVNPGDVPAVVITAFTPASL